MIYYNNALEKEKNTNQKSSTITTENTQTYKENNRKLWKNVP